MADHRANTDIVGPRPRSFNAGKTEPDLHLIKQAKQVNNVGFGRSGQRFARIRGRVLLF
jgi:hypothetical protein